MPDSSRFALDSFALLAVFLNEVGGPRVVDLLESAADENEFSLCVVNLGEVLYRLENAGHAGTAAEALTRVHSWPIELVSVDQDMAIAASKVKAERRMGYLDCFVVALAQRLDATVVTGDPDFHRVEDLVSIEWLER